VGKHFFGRQSDTITPTVCYFAFVACPKVGVKAQDAAAQICEPNSAEIASSKTLAQMSFRAMVERAVDSSLDYTSTARLAGKHGNLAQPSCESQRSSCTSLLRHHRQSWRRKQLSGMLHGIGLIATMTIPSSRYPSHLKLQGL